MPDASTPEVLSVSTTLGSRAAAQQLGREILARRLAACVQVEEGLLSLYHWKGQLCEEPEVRLVIKTLPACAPALQALFAEHHPYDVPQFLAVKMSASPDYAAWLRSEVAVPESGPEARS
jgi:periplasmic divalent cation tolerance protein